MGAIATLVVSTDSSMDLRKTPERTQLSNLNKSLVFLGIAFGITWTTVAVGWLFGGKNSPVIATITMAAMMFGPSIAAVICSARFDRANRREALGLRFKANSWWFWAWLLAVTIISGSVIVTVAAGQATFADPEVNYLSQLRKLAPEQADLVADWPIAAILVVQSLFLNAALSVPWLIITEELGWRGYLYHLWRPLGFMRFTLASGALWGAWHAPAIYLFGLNFPDNREIGVPMFVAFCILFSFPHTLVRDRSQSVVAPAILHATCNTAGGTSMLFLSQVVFPWNGVVGLGGFLVLAVIAAISWLISLRSPPYSVMTNSEHGA